MSDGVVTIGWSNSALEAGVAKAKGIVAGFKSSARGALQGIGVGQFLGLAGAVGGVKMLGDYMGNIADMADKLDASAEAVQHLNTIAKTSGTDLESVATGLLKIERGLFEVENSKAAAAFKNLGITAENFANLDADQQLLKLAEAFQESEKTGRGFADIYDLVGKKAGDLLPILRSNIDALRDMTAQDVLSEEQIRQMDDFGDRLVVMQSESAGLASKLGDVLGTAAAGFAGMFQGQDPSQSFRYLDELREEKAASSAAKDEERMKRKKARIEEINRLEAEAASKREAETQRQMALEAEKARKQAADVAGAEGNLQVSELRAAGRGGAADKLARQLKFDESVQKFKDMAPDKGEAWAQSMARRQQAVDDRNAHPGRIRGVGYQQPEQWSGLNWIYGHNRDRGAGSLTRDFKFPALEAMRANQKKQDPVDAVETTNGLLGQLLQLWRTALGT